MNRARHAQPDGLGLAPAAGSGFGPSRPIGPCRMSRLLALTLVLGLIAGLLGGWAVSGEEPQGQPESAEASAAVAEVPATEPPTEESPEQARRRALVTEHGEEIADAILAGAVVKGMSTELVLLVRGEPARREVIPPDAQLWHYADGEVAFAEGKVSYVSLAVRLAPPLVNEPTPDQPPPGPDRDQSPEQHPAQAGVPPIRVGDTYIYESTDPDGKDPSLKTRRTVTSTQGKVVLSSISLDSKNAKARYLHFNQKWNLLATRNADGSGLDYSPPLKYYDFPLFPGKTWQQTTTETNTKTGATRIHTVSGVVGAWETVSVPAGTFRAIKVSLQTELFDPNTGERIPGTDVSWYVPEVRRSVKSLTSGKGGSRRLIQLLRYEVSRGG